VVTAMMLNMDSQWRPVHDAVESAIDVAFEGASPPKDFKLKGRVLYKALERGKSPYLSVYERLLRLLLVIPRRNLVPVWYGAVDLAGFKFQMRAFRQKAAYSDPHRPFKIALEECMTRIDTYIHADRPDEQVMWIHDMGTLNDPANRTLQGLRWLRKEAESVVFENLGVPLAEPNDSHIADSIYFGNDEESRLLQLVDVCCSTITRALRFDPIVYPFYEILRGQIQNDGVRPTYENAERWIASARAYYAKKRQVRK